MTSFHSGKAVRYGDVNGSWGRIDSANHYGGYYVRWNYGLDVKGEPVTAMSSVRPNEMLPLDEEVAKKYFNCRCFSDEQHAIKESYFNSLKTKQETTHVG